MKNPLKFQRVLLLGFKEAFLNAFKNFFKANVDLRALLPAALFPFPDCNSESVLIPQTLQRFFKLII